MSEHTVFLYSAVEGLEPAIAHLSVHSIAGNTFRGFQKSVLAVMEERLKEPSTRLLGSEMKMTVYTSSECVNLKEEKSYEGWHTHAGHL